MRILFIASRFPYPLTQGDRLRAYHQIYHLSQHHQVTLFAPIQTHEEYEGLETIKALCERVELFPISSIHRVLNLVKTPFTTLPWQVIYYFDRKTHVRVRELISEQSFDIIHVQLARMAPLVEGINKIPKVLDFIDALSLNMARRAQEQDGLLSWVAKSEARRMLKYERYLTNNFQQMLVSSATDRKAIGCYPNLHVVPNGVNLKKFIFAENDREPNSIVFIGNMGYFPNTNAAQYFITNIMPLIRKEIPEVSFTVVGPSPSSALQRLCQQSGVTCTGYVPSAYEYLSRTAVAIAPMRSGSGIQNKVLEAMATGTPVVATRYGIGGLDAECGKHLLIADRDEEFAQHIIKLLRDNNMWKEVSLNAKQFVQEYFTWEASVDALIKVYQTAIRMHEHS